LLELLYPVSKMTYHTIQ